MKALSVGWRPQSGAGRRWDEDYISRLYTAVWGRGGRWDEGYISRLETTVWGWGGE